MIDIMLTHQRSDMLHVASILEAVYHDNNTTMAKTNVSLKQFTETLDSNQNMLLAISLTTKRRLHLCRMLP